MTVWALFLCGHDWSDLLGIFLSGEGAQREMDRLHDLNPREKYSVEPWEVLD